MTEDSKEKKMLAGKETNPEHLLPSGKIGLGKIVPLIFVFNIVVFGTVFGICYLLFSQNSDGALKIAEVVTAVTLIISIVALIVKRKD